MTAFFSENLSTIIVGAFVFGVIAFALARIVLNRRRGKCPCGCGACPGSAGR
jgi:hypothetical protein